MKSKRGYAAPEPPQPPELPTNMTQQPHTLDYKVVLERQINLLLQFENDISNNMYAAMENAEAIRKIVETAAALPKSVIN